jgi:hypothetical protein
MIGPARLGHEGDRLLDMLKLLVLLVDHELLNFNN